MGVVVGGNGHLDVWVPSSYGFWRVVQGPGVAGMNGQHGAGRLAVWWLYRPGPGWFTHVPVAAFLASDLIDVSSMKRIVTRVVESLPAGVRVLGEPVADPGGGYTGVGPVLDPTSWDAQHVLGPVPGAPVLARLEYSGTGFVVTGSGGFDLDKCKDLYWVTTETDPVTPVNVFIGPAEAGTRLLRETSIASLRGCR